MEPRACKFEEIRSMEPRVDAEKPESRRAAKPNSSGSGEGIIVKQPLPSSLGRSRKALNVYRAGTAITKP